MVTCAGLIQLTAAFEMPMARIHAFLGRMTAFIRLGLFLWALAHVFPVEGNAAPAASARPSSFAGNPLPQRVYIWQRVWSPALCRSLQSRAAEFSAVDFLAAEISFTPAAPTVSYAAPNWRNLRTVVLPIGLVVRIGPCRSSWDPGAAETKTVLAVCAQVLARARANGIEPAELQLDFDSATARLRDYAVLLQNVRQTVAPPRLVITTLPTWLQSPDFGALVGKTDAYVLQVHFLDKPDSSARTFTLCDPVRAARWIQKASALGRPFRIALPAYGYRVAFDSGGKFIGLQAEGPSRAWPEGTVLRTVWADAPQIAQMVSGLASAIPPACESLCWFRLPCDDDRLAWRWPTLVEVMNGRVPHAEFAVSENAVADGTIDVLLTNRGTNQGAPDAFRLSWHGARMIAGDAAGGWRLEREGDEALVLRPPAGSEGVLVSPGDSARIGWLRLDAPAAIEAAPAR
jgi:hypothetical protein